LAIHADPTPFCSGNLWNPLRFRGGDGLAVTSDPVATDENPGREFLEGRSPWREQSGSVADAQQRLKWMSSLLPSRRGAYTGPGRSESSFCCL